MSNAAIDPAEAEERELRRAVAQAGDALRSLEPILRHMLGQDASALFSDDVIARVRGMLSDLAEQLYRAGAEVPSDAEPDSADDKAADEKAPDEKAADAKAIAAISTALAKVPGLLGHLHALAHEWRTAQQLQARLGLDPVVPPLLQALIASPEAETAESAMKLLAAQARFGRHQQQMRMPLGELPGELLHGVLQCLPASADGCGNGEASIRQAYGEGATRLGLMARLVTAMGGGAVAGLAIAHSGVAIFSTALALQSGQSRDSCVLALVHGQEARLALMLRATPMKLATLHATLLALGSLGPTAGARAEAIARMPADRAAALLAESSVGHGAGN